MLQSKLGGGDQKKKRERKRQRGTGYVCVYICVCMCACVHAACCTLHWLGAFSVVGEVGSVAGGLVSVGEDTLPDRPDFQAVLLHLVRLFWNQILTWLSLSPSRSASRDLSAVVRYWVAWNAFSSSSIWFPEKVALPFFSFLSADEALSPLLGSVISCVGCDGNKWWLSGSALGSNPTGERKE